MKLAIYDDHPLVVQGLNAMLSPYGHIQVTGCYHEQFALLQGLKAELPDVLIAICREGDCYNNLPIVLHKVFPRLAILILVSESSVGKLKNMISHGRKGYLMKKTDQQTLLEALETIYRGDIFIDPKLKEHLLFLRLTSQKSTELSCREKEILQLITEEYTAQEIAVQLHLSCRTVENHRTTIMQKLGVKNTAGLVKYALQAGLVE